MFAPAPDDINETHGRWLEREPGIFERADWDEDERRLVLSVRGRGVETSLTLAWVSVTEWRELLAEEGFAVRACTAGSTAAPGPATRTRSGFAVVTDHFLVVPRMGEISLLTGVCRTGSLNQSRSESLLGQVDELTGPQFQSQQRAR